MLAKLKNRLNNRKGFTLVELIVVIAIIAILAAVLLPQMAGFTKKAKNSNTLSEAKNIATAIAIIIAERPDTVSITSANYSTDYESKVQALAGTYTGAVSITGTVNATNGVNFTYTNATIDSTYTVTVTNGQAKAN